MRSASLNKKNWVVERTVGEKVSFHYRKKSYLKLVYNKATGVGRFYDARKPAIEKALIGEKSIKWK